MELLEGTLRVDDLDDVLATLSEVGDRHDVTIQAFDARYVAGRGHLERAVECAERARERGEMIARDPAVEILCYAAGRRQIERALEMGVAAGDGPATILVTGGDREADRAGRLERASGETASAEAEAIADLADELDLEEASVLDEADEERLADFFEITDAERAATDATLEELVCERVALLTVDK
ncbi:KEOPS complex subunit Cgi121 [Halovivax sp.]|uniref:KEOPS complex subunit Cgi121 n=1 Tax=Halovivax sp. TaxID=1935978 RepID=UPI0025C4160C|nr:KEOPS complex subunit Cgi121 [Halovivax sp.]